jgi:hypothetical protein
MKTKLHPSAVFRNTLLALSVFIAQASAQYVTNFDTGFDPGFSLSGQIDTDPLADQWASNDVNQPDYVGIIGGYSQTAGDYWGALGGLVVAPFLYPTQSTVELSKSVTFANPADASNVYFSTRMAITTSVTPQTAKDSFSWTFKTAGGDDIVSLDFTPSANPLVVQFKWTDYNGNQTATPNGIGYGTQFDLLISITNLDSTPVFKVTYDAVGPDPAIEIINTTLSALTPDQVGQFAATWTLSNLSGGSPYANYGYNAMLFDGVSLVPEPASLGLLLLGSTLLLAKRRRHRVS